MRVLLATDGSADSRASVDLLLGLEPDSGITATVLAVTPQLPLPGADLEAPPGVEADDAVDIARAIVDTTCERLRSAGFDATPMVRYGNPVEEILAASTELGPDLVVLGMRGVGRLRRLLAGSVASSVARLATAPVLLAQDPASLSVALIATDGSPGAERALETFRKLPPSSINRAILLQVDSGSPAAPAQPLESALESLRAAGLEVSLQTAHGNEVEQIVRVADETGATLIVLGASRHRVDNQPVLGTTANGVINRAPCSILIGR